MPLPLNEEADGNFDQVRLPVAHLLTVYAQLTHVFVQGSDVLCSPEFEDEFKRES